MGDLKPLGSERLQGMDKLKRIMQIANYKQPVNKINESTAIDENSTSEYRIKLADGFYYGIVRENKGYILKTSVDSQNWSYMNGITERKYYNSYSQALKRLNIVVSENSRNNGVDYEIPLIGEQESPKKKFILKRPKPAGGGEETPTADLAPPSPMDAGTPPAPPITPPSPMDAGVPPMDAGTPPAPMDAGAPPMDAGVPPMDAEAPTMDAGAPPMDTGVPPMDAETPPMGMEDESAPSDEGEEVGPTGLKTIQKLTGRLSQKLRSFDKDKGMDSQDIKYVLNSIISAMDLSSLDDDDRDDILNKLEDMDEYGAEDMGDMDLSGDEDMGMEEPMGGTDMGMGEPAPPAEPPVTENKVNKILSKYFSFSDDEKPLLEEKKKKEFIKKKMVDLKVKREIENLSETTKQMVVAKKLFSESTNLKFVGKTNQNNLLFTSKGNKIRITPQGRII
jgi:hypothetical protein